MSLLIGTLGGAYLLPNDGSDPIRTLDATVHRLRSFDVGCFAATSEGLYRTTDGQTWQSVGTSTCDVTSVVLSPDGERLYVGMKPAAVYVTSDEGATWSELDSLQTLPDRDRWRDRAQGEGACVRTMVVHPNAPDRLAVGIEPGGVYLSVDGGETWTSRSNGVHDDVHHLLALDVDEYVAACGNGFYRTEDAGRTWVRQDTDFRDFWYTYFRETIRHDGTLYTAANGWGPAEPSGALFEVTGDDVARVPYPGENDSFVVSWAEDRGTLYAGTMDVTDGFGRYDPGRILRRESSGWFEVATVPAAPRTLATVQVA
ncbi:WD40/YVTN/BNR-like repeat-containing protein [Haloarchaeobius sp. HRN-SO-5]|uniref:WD40/YVTN/BNR-like repeat-containing protein n=1 Tax=Haloarchaeobius sp. HRN-SO-5 TaxID=3446118 RepID=UPI003EBC175F